MSDGEKIILDNSVLAAFYNTGWFSSLKFWTPQKSIVVPEVIWESEFKPYYDVSQCPGWLEIEPTSHSSLDISDPPGQLSVPDWSCVAVVENSDGEAWITTNDKELKKVAEDRDITVEWGTAFAIMTYRECGISERSYNDNRSDYIEDVVEKGFVENAVLNAEKR